MFVLFETPGGYALFKLTDEKKILSSSLEDLIALENKNASTEYFQLKAFDKFKDTDEALTSAASLVQGKLCKPLKKFLKKNIPKGESLAIAETKLAGAIQEKLGLHCVVDSQVQQLFRLIRNDAHVLLDEYVDNQKSMILGLAHSLSRYKLKFSTEKVDTMIIQSIGLLDDLDKEINTYSMRLREWYGWHFPELAKIVNDNTIYARIVHRVGIRTNAKNTQLDDIIGGQEEKEVKEAAEVSMGTELSDEDVSNIRELCDQVITLSEYRSTLYEYLKNRMAAIAPNLTAMVGELVGARLISHAGSLMNLAKYPASTVQILGAEKALFRALKTKSATPKYGLIFHASLVGQAAPKYKGKISRALASKTALSIRADALNEGELDNSLGLENRAKIEARLRQLESRQTFSLSGRGRTSGGDFKAYQSPRTPASGYQTVTDTVIMTDSRPTGQVVEETPSNEGNENGITTKKTVQVDKEENEKESSSSHKKKEKKKRKRESAGEEKHDKDKKKKHKEHKKE
ncbi:box C/D snoRNP component Nop58 [Galdieria sulphuraria]|uniref:Nucleolar protein 58 n=1 Tax=Galdieria sulphuraria TaxID=130081 RepID=M2XEZ6_GALSU|nr:box C/D snoRNP component Nop58 [Galdieria sulphuraria]EME28572.1 box C/D snoRNP component Nop58 [Galdieria sulphuraria]|eukprot:XP_005705092.1 box C/D snoRNP component Nop58 [Galdieria sulphuraria]